MSNTVTLPRFVGQGYVARLQRHGFEIIGKGGDPALPATYVLAKPGSDAVVKVGMSPAGDPWPQYAEWCMGQPGPFRPVVRSLRWHGSRAGLSRFFVASLDRLDKPQWEAGEAAILSRMLCHWYDAAATHGIDLRQWQDEATYARLGYELAAGLRHVGLPDAALFVLDLLDAFPGFALDPQPPNWMVTRDGRLVLIDPFTRIPWDLPETASRMVRKAT